MFISYFKEVAWEQAPQWGGGGGGRGKEGKKRGQLGAEPGPRLQRNRLHSPMFTEPYAYNSKMFIMNTISINFN